VVLEGESVLDLPPKRLRQIRGGRVGMVFQNPATALNPVYRVGVQIAEAIGQHRRVTGREARAMAVEALAEVRMADPTLCARAYPHELSGGMQQRVMLAQALCCDPALLIADEPTAALDRTVQAEILALLHQAQRDRGLAVLLVTHDLSLVTAACDRVAVMYAGRVVEVAPAPGLLDAARHPYTRALVQAMPDRAVRLGRLRPVPGAPPHRGLLAEEAAARGCPFRPRCERDTTACAVAPSAVRVAPRHWVSCHHPAAESEADTAREGPSP
jgi:oligopeptide/dipeptide ABC transporter ATP-binding protein